MLLENSIASSIDSSDIFFGKPLFKKAASPARIVSSSPVASPIIIAVILVITVGL